jgi:hypothetical protein
MLDRFPTDHFRSREIFACSEISKPIPENCLLLSKEFGFKLQHVSRVTSFQSLPRDVPGFWRTRLEIVCHSYQFPSRKSWLAEPSTLVLNIQFFDIFKRPLLSLSTFYATCDAASELSRWKFLLSLQTTIFRPLLICSSFASSLATNARNGSSVTQVILRLGFKYLSGAERRKGKSWLNPA